MSKSKKVNKKGNNKKVPFDEDKFDRKVAQSISNIHATVKRKRIEKAYNKWCDDNLEHLERLYNLSGLGNEFDEFCNYVFNNSEILRKTEYKI